MGYKGVNTKLQEEWAALEAVLRAPYYKLYEEGRERSHKEQQEKSKHLRKKHGPKGYVQASKFYVSAQRKRIRKQNPGMDHNGVTRKAWEEWAALDAAGRAPYDEMQEEDKKRDDLLTYQCERCSYNTSFHPNFLCHTKHHCKEGCQVK